MRFKELSDLIQRLKNILNKLFKSIQMTHRVCSQIPLEASSHSKKHADPKEVKGETFADKKQKKWVERQKTLFSCWNMIFERQKYTINGTSKSI